MSSTIILSSDDEDDDDVIMVKEVKAEPNGDDGDVVFISIDTCRSTQPIDLTVPVDNDNPDSVSLDDKPELPDEPPAKEGDELDGVQCEDHNQIKTIANSDQTQQTDILLSGTSPGNTVCDKANKIVNNNKIYAGKSDIISPYNEGSLPNTGSSNSGNGLSTGLVPASNPSFDTASVQSVPYSCLSDTLLSQNLVYDWDLSMSSNPLSGQRIYSNQNMPLRKRLKTEQQSNSFIAQAHHPQPASTPPYSAEAAHRKFLYCYMCKKEALKVSSCTDGHPTCNFCLEIHVKAVLCQKDETQKTLKCKFRDCGSYYLISQLKLTLPSMVVEILESQMEQQCTHFVTPVPEELEPIALRDPDTPEHWDRMIPNTPYTLAKVEPGSEEYARISTKFHETMPFGLIDIDEIFRVQNPILWKFYTVKKEQMKVGKTAVSERILFHGTNPKCVDAICKSGFDWRLCGVNGTAYGRGSYFAESSKYSHQYSVKGLGQSMRQMSVVSHRMKKLLSQKPSSNAANPSPHLNISQIYHRCLNSTYLPLQTLGQAPLNLSTISPTSQPNMAVSSTSQTQGTDTTNTSPLNQPLNAGIPSFTTNITPLPILEFCSTPLPTRMFKMFAARVLVGQYTLGSSDMVKPPPINPVIDPMGQSYDSCVDCCNNPKIFVVFDSAQAYPEYVIHYKYLG